VRLGVAAGVAAWRRENTIGQIRLQLVLKEHALNSVHPQGNTVVGPRNMRSTGC
jgi:hypothetical protein